MGISSVGGECSLLTSFIIIKLSLGTRDDYVAELCFLASPACRCGRETMVSPKPREQK